MEATGYQPFGSVPWPVIEPMADGDPLSEFMLPLPDTPMAMSNAEPASPVISPGAPRSRQLVGGLRRSASRNNTEARQRAEQIRLLREAHESFCSELAVNSTFAADNMFPEDVHRVLITKSVPTTNHVKERVREVKAHTNLSLRAPPLDESESDEDEDGDEDEHESTPLREARGCYRGTAVSGAELESMDPRERYSNLRYLDGTWVRPPGDQSPHRDNMYYLAPNAFGERLDTAGDLEAVTKEFAKARVASSQATTLCSLIACHVTRFFGAPPRVYNVEDGVAKIQAVYNRVSDDSPFEPAPAQFRENVRQLKGYIGVRMKHLREGNRINERLQGILVRHRTDLPTEDECVSGNILTLRTTFTTDDLMKSVVDHFDPYDARRLLTTCKWGEDITKLLHDRFPRLHIYRIPNVFPHYVDASGTGYMHRDTNIKVAVGLIYTKRRDLKSDGTEESDPGEANRPGVQCFDVQHTVVGGKNVASWTGYDQPWTQDTKRITIHPTMFFKSHPELKVTLLDAATNEPLIPISAKELHGGLIATKLMARLEHAGKTARLLWNQGTENPAFAAMHNEDFATINQFKVGPLLSSRIQCHFKIRADAIGTSRVTGRPLTLSTESEAFSIVSKLAACKKMSTGKRKRDKP